MKFLRLKDVCEMTSKKQSQVYKEVSLGLFPKPMALGGKSMKGWLESEVHRMMRVIIRGGDLEALAAEVELIEEDRGSA